MKINSINSINYLPYNINFKHTAVPYPEYENAYYNNTQTSSIEKAVNKIAALFTPEVTEKSKQIKNGINKIYNDNKSGQLSVYA